MNFFNFQLNVPATLKTKIEDLSFYEFMSQSNVARTLIKTGMDSPDLKIQQWPKNEGDVTLSFRLPLDLKRRIWETLEFLECNQKDYLRSALEAGLAKGL